MKINHNIPALRTLNQLNKVNDKSAKTMMRLSSGLRINSAADDAAGLAISQKMDTQVRGLRQANRNAMDGISMIQTAEGALNEVHAMLQRMRELTVQAANDTYDEADKTKIQDEILELQEEMISIGERTEFNKKKLINGSHDKFMLQVGANEKQSMKISGSDINLDSVLLNIYGMPIDSSGGVDIDLGALPEGTKISYDGMTHVIDGNTPSNEIIVPAETLVVIQLPTSGGVTLDHGTISTTINAGEKLVFKTGQNPVTFNEIDGATNKTEVTPDEDTAVILPISNTENKMLFSLMDNESTDDALVRLDKAIEMASKARGKLGAYQNRLEHTVNNLGVSEENLTASMSRIQDADMALEMSTYTQQNILSQAATSMLAQANQRPQQILQLLQN